jgi:ankyrin repeat protein
MPIWKMTWKTTRFAFSGLQYQFPAANPALTQSTSSTSDLDLAHLIEYGMTKEALSALDSGADPNSRDTNGQPVICVAIACGNVEVVKKLLEQGAVSRAPEVVKKANPKPQSAPLTKALIIISFIIPQSFLLASDAPSLLKFAILFLPTEGFVWSTINERNFPKVKAILWATIVTWMILTSLSWMFGGFARSFGTFCFHSRTWRAYLSRRLLLLLIHPFFNPPVWQVQSPPELRILLLRTLFDYTGDAEEMALALLEHDIHLGDTNDAHGLSICLWIWVATRGYFRVAQNLLERHPLHELEPFRRQHDHSFPSILTFCASRGSAEFMELLFQHGSDFYDDADLSEALLACLSEYSRDARPEIVSLLLQHGANANATDRDGRSALSWACQWSTSHHLVPLLITAGAGSTIDSTDENGQTVLHHAAWKHDPGTHAVVDMLIKAGATLDVADNSGHSPLWNALSLGCWPTTVSFLLEQGSTPDFRGEGSNTPLMEACRHSTESSIIIIAMLLAYGADPNATTKDDTPLISACYRQYSKDRDDMVYMLLQAGARPVMPPEFPCQPLVESAWCTRLEGGWMLEILEAAQAQGPVPIEVVNMAMERLVRATPSIPLNSLGTLLLAGGDPRFRPKFPAFNGGSLVHCVSRATENFRGDTKATIQYLVALGPTVDDRDDKGRTPLHVAVRAINQRAVEKLTDHGSVVDAVDSKGRTPLAYACKTKPTWSTGYTVLGVHPDLDQPEYSGKRMQNVRSAIIADRGKQVQMSITTEDIIYHLLEQGADPLAEDNLGMTPLHLACKVGNPITAGVILQNRENLQSTPPPELGYSMKDLVGARDHSRMTPLHWAARSGNVELVLMILAANALLQFGDEGTREADRKYPFHVAFLTDLVLAVDHKKYTPMHYAIEEGHEDVVKIFLSEVDIFDRWVEDIPTYIDIAAACGHSEIAEMLAVAQGKVGHERRHHYQRRNDFNNGDWCGLECKWCKYQWCWMNGRDVMGLVAARAQGVLKQLEINVEANFGEGNLENVSPV